MFPSLIMVSESQKGSLEDCEVGGQELFALYNVSESNEDNQTQWSNSVHCTAFKINIGKEFAKMERERVEQVKLQVCDVATLFTSVVDKLANVERIDGTVGQPACVSYFE